MECQGNALVTDHDADLGNPRKGEDTVIGSGTRKWLIRQFEEIDLRFGPAPSEPPKNK